jgi:CheY-like chemotaxis protein
MEKYNEIDIVNHEIRTPLAGLLGMTHELSRGPLSLHQKTCLDNMHVAGQMLLHAVGKFLQKQQSATSQTTTQTCNSAKIVKKSEKQIALLVEDSPLIQQVHTWMLEELGYQVHVVSTGKKSLRLFEKYDYAIALVDVGLPDMSGVEVIRAMKKYKRKTQIITATACISQEVINSCLEAGSDFILNKPIAVGDLKNLLIADE